MKLTRIFETSNNDNLFFGYYDVPQLSKNNKYIICQKIKNIRELPKSPESYEIFLYDITNNKSEKIGTTRTLNFQQGSRAQWLGPDHKSKIIFNDCINNSYVSKIYDLNTKETKIIPLPIFSVSVDGKYIISADYERLYWCRKGYSYDVIRNQDKNKNIVRDEKVKLYELEKDKFHDLFSIEDLLKINESTIMKDATHYIEHLMFSPCNQKFIFLHRFKINDGGIFSRLFEYNLENKHLKILLDSGRISHFNFIDSNRLIFYGSIGNKITKLRKFKKFQIAFKFMLRIYKLIVKDNSNLSKKITNDGYYYYEFSSNNFTKIKNFNLNSEDGHPTTHKKLNMSFITDNYADLDNNNKARLIFYSHENNKYETLDVINSIKELDNSPLRCDLHPRISYDGNYLSIDAFGNNNRKIIVYKIDQ